MEATRFCKRIGAQAEYWKVPDYVEVCERCEFYYSKPEADAVIARLEAERDNIQEDFNGRLKPSYDFVDGIAVSVAEDEIDRLTHQIEVLNADLTRCQEAKTAIDDKCLRLEAEVQRLRKVINDEITFLHDEGEHAWADCLEEDLGEN